MSQAVATASLELSVAQTGFQLMALSLSASQVLGLQGSATLPDCGPFQMIGWHTPENGSLASAECAACTWVHRGLSHTPKIV